MREETETPPDPAVRSESSRRTVAALALVFAWGVLFRAALVPRPRPGRFWDTESYVRYARRWASRGLPHLGSRTPGYPLLLLAAGTPIPRARRVVRAQRGLGVACGGLVFVLVLAMTRRRSSATAAGLAAPLLLDLTFMELVIYSETLGAMLALAALTGLAFASAARRGRRTAALAGAAAAGLVPTVRPVFGAALPVFAAAVVVLFRRKRLGRASALAGLGLIFGPTVFLVSVNLIRDGRPALAREHSILDYAGFPELYRRLPPRLADIRAVLEEAGSRHADGRAAWSETIDGLVRLERDRTGREPDSYKVAASVARRVIAAAPLGYAQVWADTAWRFFSDFELSMGFYASTEEWQAQRPQLSGRRRATMSAARSALKVIVPLLSVAAMLGPPAIAFVRRRRFGRARLPFAVWLGWALVIAVAIPTISLEPWAGTGRYRQPVELPILALAAWTVAELSDGVRRVVRALA